MTTIDKIFVSLIALALVAVLVSSRSATSQALTTGFNAVISGVKALMSPVSH